MIQEIKFDTVDSNGYAKKIGFKNKKLNQCYSIRHWLLKPSEMKAITDMKDVSGKMMNQMTNRNILGANGLLKERGG